MENCLLHTCPAADHDSTYSADVGYAELLPSLFEPEVGIFYIATACEADRDRASRIVARDVKAEQRAFIDDVNDPRVVPPDEVCACVLQAARHIPLDRFDTTDDCGFSPFCDDVSIRREIAFAKIRARVEGTAMAARQLGLAGAVKS
jgi:5-methyltetrahydropteroyltriglutamate--homocysteine methyltransferase